MNSQYESYTVIQFLDDPFFIEWVRHKTPESEVFWKSWKERNPANLNEMQEARHQLLAFLSAQPVEAAPDERMEVWEKIRASLQRSGDIIDTNPDAGVSRVRPLFKSWWAAAVLVLVMVSAGYLIWRNAKGGHQINVAKKEIQEDRAPGGNKAVLTLADGTKIVLDSASNGTITRQGNITVIKMDGQLAYQGGSANTGKEVAYNTITTPKGGQYQLVLADGSRIWLNAASSLRFPVAFPGKERRVELAGEGYFEVAHHADQPFDVVIAGMEVQVLGTHFNINSYADEESVKTTLLEGSVLVKAKNLKKEAVIVPGQQTILSANELTVDKNADVDEAVAWKNGLFQFSGADISTIMRQIGRWYNVEASFAGDARSIQISGKVSRNLNLSQIIEVLEQSGIEVKRNGDQLIARPKP